MRVDVGIGIAIGTKTARKKSDSDSDPDGDTDRKPEKNAPLPKPYSIRKAISAVRQLDRRLPSMARGPGLLPGRQNPRIASVPVIPARMPESRAKYGYLADPAELRR